LSRTCPDCQSTYDDEVLHCPEDGHNLALEPAVDELIGRTVGSYTVVKPLGKGGMGAVYMGEHPVIGSRVAIKFLHPQYAHDEKIVDRFFNEARAVNVIGHDNILKIIDLNVTEDNRHYFVMEFLLGRALQNLIKHHVAIPLEVSGPILLQICEALEAAHRKGIIHRDLKPDNIYLISHKGKKNFVKVVDFGIAKLTDVQGASTGRTQTGMVMGTPAYMSPEQGSGKTSTIDGRSDIYSLGIIMFQLATGRLPFRGEDFGAMLVAHLQQAPPDPRELAAGTPEEFAQIILRCLEKSQDDRFQSMAELGEAIAACMDRLGISRDLPADDATDFELNPVELRELRASSNPGLRTPSQPGRSTRPVTGRGSSPGARPGPRSNPGASSPGARKSLPGARPAGEGSSTPPRSRSLPPTPPPAAGSKLPILAGVIGALILVGGGIGYGVKLGNDKAEQAVVKANAIAAREARAQTAARRDAAEEDSSPIFLSVVSDPLEAEVQASWKGGETSGSAPLSVEVPRNAKVHFEIHKAGFLPFVTEVLADQNQAVNAKLEASPEASEATADRPQHSRHRRDGARQKEEVPATKDGVIDLSDALK
jgi:serine/threonine protein kinase